MLNKVFQVFLVPAQLHAEVMDKEPTALMLWALSLALCTVGALAVYRWRVLILLSLPLALLPSYLAYQEWTDPFVGPAMHEEAGPVYGRHLGAIALWVLVIHGLALVLSLKSGRGPFPKRKGGFIALALVALASLYWWKLQHPPDPPFIAGFYDAKSTAALDGELWLAAPGRVQFWRLSAIENGFVHGGTLEPVGFRDLQKSYILNRRSTRNDPHWHLFLKDPKGRWWSSAGRPLGERPLTLGTFLAGYREPGKERVLLQAPILARYRLIDAEGQPYLPKQPFQLWSNLPGWPTCAGLGFNDGPVQADNEGRFSVYQPAGTYLELDLPYHVEKCCDDGQCSPVLASRHRVVLSEGVTDRNGEVTISRLWNIEHRLQKKTAKVHLSGDPALVQEVKVSYLVDEGCETGGQQTVGVGNFGPDGKIQWDVAPEVMEEVLFSFGGRDYYPFACQNYGMLFDGGAELDFKKVFPKLNRSMSDDTSE